MEKFLEEINERYKANQKQIDFHNKELRTLYDNEQALIKEFCDGLCKKYAEFIGKYVKVKSKNSSGDECVADGFLLGLITTKDTALVFFRLSPSERRMAHLQRFFISLMILSLLCALQALKLSTQPPKRNN